MATTTEKKSDAPENWEYVGGGGEHSAIGDERYQNDCGLWLVIEGTKVVTWVGNFHVAVRGTKDEIGEYENREAAREAAQEWMDENPNPWSDG